MILFQHNEICGDVSIADESPKASVANDGEDADKSKKNDIVATNELGNKIYDYLSIAKELPSASGASDGEHSDGDEVAVKHKGSIEALGKPAEEPPKKIFHSTRPRGR